LVWLVPLSGISTFWGAILNASEAFTMVALAPAAVPVMGLTAMIWLVPQYGIDALAWGTVAGYGAEFLLLYTAIRLRGTPILPVWRGHAEAGYIIRQYGCLFGGTLLMSSSLLVDQSMATWVGEGSVTVLTYGYKLVAVLLGTVSLGLTTAVFPHFSQLVASGQRADIEHTLKRLVKLVLLSSIPLTAFLILFSRPIVSLLFESSAMDADTVTTIAIVQACYLLHVPIFMASVLGARLLTALGGSHILLQNSVINLLANCIGNLLLLKLFGIAGIALSTSCVYLLSAWLIYRGLRLRLNELVAAELLKSRPARAA
jgi:putative peptidoglycan lipid II flippase